MKRNIILGTAVLLMAAFGAYASAKSSVVGAYYIDPTTDECLLSTQVVHPCEQLQGVCIKFVPEINTTTQLFNAKDPESNECIEPLREF